MAAIKGCAGEKKGGLRAGESGEEITRIPARKPGLCQVRLGGLHSQPSTLQGGCQVLQSVGSAVIYGPIKLFLRSASRFEAGGLSPQRASLAHNRAK